MAVCQILPVGLVEVNNNTRKSSIQSPEFTMEEMKEKNGHQQGIWTSIQEQPTTNKDTTVDLPPPYVHPLLRRSASFMSQSSLELCTESLGSETGSDGFSDMEDDDYYHSSSEDQEEESEEEEEQQQFETPKYSFPPPLSSISRSEIRAQRRDGRLVMEALPLPSQNYLRCQRQGGRLLLSFIDPVVETEAGSDYEQGKDDVVDGEVEEEEAEEKVEVVDEGMVVAVKVKRSTSLEINRFVGVDMKELLEKEKADAQKWRVPRNNMALPNILVDTKKVAVNRGEALIQQTRRCGMQQRRSVFIWEPCNSAAAT